jgi:hypothetical protein
MALICRGKRRSNKLVEGSRPTALVRVNFACSDVRCALPAVILPAPILGSLHPRQLMKKLQN